MPVFHNEMDRQNLLEYSFKTSKGVELLSYIFTAAQSARLPTEKLIRDRLLPFTNAIALLCIARYGNINEFQKGNLGIRIGRLGAISLMTCPTPGLQRCLSSIFASLPRLFFKNAYIGLSRGSRQPAP